MAPLHVFETLSPSTTRGLSLRRSFSSSPSPRSPSISPEGSPHKRPQRRRETNDYKSLYRLLWTATWLCAVTVLRWKFCASLRSASNPPRILEEQDDRWKNASVVQVIQTRFMQEQPDLVDLGMARLEIFKIFCLPTLVGQSSNDFLWIIRTDPMLNDTVKQPLLDLLQPFPNFVLIASNLNPEGFRAPFLDISPESVWSGSYDLIREYHEAAQTRVLLESRLDADDGLHYGFVEYMQTAALPGHGTWKIWCALTHLEWHANSPFNKEKSDYGFLVGIKNSGCVTPGLTMAYGLGASRDDLPRGTHQYLHKLLPPCCPDTRSYCLERFSLKPGAIRARTPTSAGMAHLVEEGNKRKYMHSTSQAQLQDKIWAGAEPIFGMDRQQIVSTKNYLTQHLGAIAADNLKGQCTKGHSCKQEAKTMLRRIVNQST